MIILCCDDEKIILDSLVFKCKSIDFVTEVYGFTSGIKLLAFLNENQNLKVDVAILDIDMPDISGLNLANEIKQTSAETEIIFQTGFSEFAVEAFKVRASGYLLKPISKDDLLEELVFIKDKKSGNSALAGKTEVKSSEQKGIYARTFGNFDLLVNGKPVEFAWKKSKEALAYLIDREGSIVDRKELAGILFDDSEYTRSKQTYLSKIIGALQRNLKEVGAADIFIKGNNSYSINVNALTCDAWDFLNGINQEKYHGEYMLQYSWAELSVSKFEKKL